MKITKIYEVVISDEDLVCGEKFTMQNHIETLEMALGMFTESYKEIRK